MSTINPTITNEIREQAAKAMADDWNPERDPILTAMFRDYAATALEAAAPLIAAKALRVTASDDELWRLTEGEQRLLDANTPYYEGVAYGFRIARSLLKDRADQIEAERCCTRPKCPGGSLCGCTKKAGAALVGGDD